MKPVGGIEPGSIQFKTETLSCQMLVQSSPSYSLILKLQPLPEHVDQWTSEELQVSLRILFRFSMWERYCKEGCTKLIVSYINKISCVFSTCLSYMSMYILKKTYFLSIMIWPFPKSERIIVISWTYLNYNFKTASPIFL